MPKPVHQVLVCTNTRPPGNPKGSCGEKGADDLFDALKQMVKDRGQAQQVMVNRASCLKHCSRGITVAVQPENTWYAAVTRNDLTDIVDSLTSGATVERLLMPDIPWE